MTEIKIEDIILDAGTQNRSDCEITASLYAELMQEGDVFPPLDIAEVLDDGDNNGLYLIDGFTRLEASKKNGKSTVSCNLRGVNTLSEAVALSFSANRSNGRRRTGGEIKAILRRIFTEPDFEELASQSLRQIASYVGCSHEMVRRVKDSCRVSSISEELDIPDDISEEVCSENIVTAFDISSKVNDIVRTLDSVNTKIDNLPELGTEIMDLAHCQYVIEQLKNSIKGNSPFKPCPHCDGGDDCHICSGRGWITKDQYDLIKKEQ